MNKILEYGLTALRVFAGVMFITFGWAKFFKIPGFAGFAGIPIWLAIIVAAIEFLGGIFLVIGLFTRYTAMLEGIVMINAFFIAHFPTSLNPLSAGGGKALMYLLIFIVLATFNKSRLAIDNRLK